MKTSLTSNPMTPSAGHLIDKLMELANRQADVVDSFPQHYRLVPPAVKRRVAYQFDEFIAQLDPLVAKIESIIQKHRIHNRRTMSLLQGAILQADSHVSAAAEETAKLPELSGLTGEFQELRQQYRETLNLLDNWLPQLDGNGDSVSLAA